LEYNHSLLRMLTVPTGTVMHYDVYIYPVRSYVVVCENKNKIYRRKFMRAADEKLMAN